MRPGGVFDIDNTKKVWGRVLAWGREMTRKVAKSNEKNKSVDHGGVETIFIFAE